MPTHKKNAPQMTNNLNGESEMETELEMGKVMDDPSIMGEGYRLLGDMPDVVNAIDRVVSQVVNGKTHAVGTANRDDIHSDVVQEVAALIGSGESVTAGNVGKLVRRVAQRYAMRTLRTIPIATGLDSFVPYDESDTESDGESESLTYWDDQYVSGDVEYGLRIPYADNGEMHRLIRSAPTLLRTVVLADEYGSAPIPDDAYGIAYKLPESGDERTEMLAETRDGNEMMERAKSLGLARPIGRKESKGKRTKDAKGNDVQTEDGNLPAVLTTAATLSTLHKRTHRYSMANELTHSQAVAIDAARSIGSIAPVMNHLGSKGDPTYMLAKSAPSAESDYLHQMQRNAETLAADETIYGTPYDVERYYVPVSRYERNTRDKNGRKLLHIRGTVRTHRHILLGDRTHKGKVTQSGMVTDYMPDANRASAMRTIGRKLRTAASKWRTVTADVEMALESYRSPMSVAERFATRPVTYRVSYAPETFRNHLQDEMWNEPDGTRYWNCDTVQEDYMIADQWAAIRKAARDVRESEIADNWHALCAIDPEAMMYENAAQLAAHRAEWRLLIGSIGSLNWSAELV